VKLAEGAFWRQVYQALGSLSLLRDNAVSYEHNFRCMNVYNCVNDIIVPGDGIINIYFFNCE
jgi:hypothetical protein